MLETNNPFINHTTQKEDLNNPFCNKFITEEERKDYEENNLENQRDHDNNLEMGLERRFASRFGSIKPRGDKLVSKALDTESNEGKKVIKSVVQIPSHNQLSLERWV